MKYKLYYEPMYVFECKGILSNIISGISIKDEMEDSIRNRGERARSSVEPLFQSSLEVEEYMKENMCLNLPGYEENGQELAEFLFKKWDHAYRSAVDVIYLYDLLLSIGIDNKAVVICDMISGDFLESVWGLKEIELGEFPPAIDDNTFFGLVYDSQLNQEGKLKVLKFYFDFDSYCDYARALLQYSEGFLKSKIGEYAADIKVHMDFVEEQLLVNNAISFKNQVSIGESDDNLYHIYPGLYRANSITMNNSNFFPYIIIGISVNSLDKLCDNVEFDNEKAIQFLKCLSDNTKLTILQLLKNESLYGSQLAEKLGCTSANISQHMNTLVNLDVVYIKKDNNRVYFYLNKDAVHGHLEVAKGLFG